MTTPRDDGPAFWVADRYLARDRDGDPVTTLRALIRKHLPVGYEEALSWGMITSRPGPAYMPATTYFVNAEPASLSEAGPSAT